MATIVPFVLYYIAVILLASVVNYVSCAQATIVEMKVNRELRQVGFKHLQTLSFSYFNQNSVGYIHARLMSDTGRIGGLVSWWLIDCTWRISYLVGAIFVMIRMNAKLALMVLTTVPLMVLLFSIFQKKLIDVNREVREVNSKITGNFNEGIMGVKIIKSLSIETVLENFSLQIPFGTHIAIVGETGAGKSALVNLVCRFYEPTQGQLLIDGRDARERSQLWLHSAIGYVLQTPHLFSGTVRENLLMGNPNATEEQIWEAIRMVSADEVIAHLEKGLDTDVGEGGDLLSTGEKQLISFARAILADPRILILDEATASVDSMPKPKFRKPWNLLPEAEPV